MIMQNIYESKHYKKYIILPVALLLISLFFIPKIQLDPSLKGGVNVQIQTNSTVDVRQLTAQIDSKIPGAQASVSRSPGGLSLTIARNSSISAAETNLLAIYSENANYTSDSFNVSRYTALLSTNQSGNTTMRAALANAQNARQRDFDAMTASLTSELNNLRPFLGAQRFNYAPTSADAVLNTSKSAYSAASANYKQSVVGSLQSVVPFTSYSYNEVTPTLGAFFLGQMTSIIIWAFVLVAITVFVVFRTPVPSFAVVFGAANDIIVALGAMGLFGIPLGVASIGGLLMLIGYSIDTDMLAAIRVLKRHDGTAAQRAFSSLKTGTTMTVAAIISFAILLIVSYYAFIPTYFDISAVVFAGLIIDLATTWLGNLPMILWYKQRKEVHYS